VASCWKNYHLWISLWIPWDTSSCTSEEEVTLHIDNCMGCPQFHKWKFKWTFFEVARDFTCSLYSFFVWPVTCRWHVPNEITCENQIFSMSFHLWNHLQVTRPKWNHLWKSKFSHELLLIEFKIHKFVYTFNKYIYILIK